MQKAIYSGKKELKSTSINERKLEKKNKNTVINALPIKRRPCCDLTGRKHIYSNWTDSTE